MKKTLILGAVAAALFAGNASSDDSAKFNWGLQASTQGAGTSNQAGVGFFLPVSVGGNSVLFLDVLANANFADFGDYSSIVNTEVDGITLSTSSRVGYRWTNDNKSLTLGVNGGYDTREMATGSADTGVPVSDSKTVDFQQVAVAAEAVSDSWNVSVYALVPVDDTEHRLNNVYQGGSLDTYGIDVGYSITPRFQTSVGYYYQEGDAGTADGSGVKGRASYSIGNGFTVGTNMSYDETFEGRVSADVVYRFGASSSSITIANRNVRVADDAASDISIAIEVCEVLCELL